VSMNNELSVYDSRTFVLWSDPSSEEQIRDSITADVSSIVVDQFSRLVRESGSQDEVQGAEFLTSFLTKWGIPHHVYYPKLYLSLPRKAEVKVTKPFRKEFRAKNPSMTALTGEEGITAPLVYLGSGYAKGTGDVFSNVLPEDATLPDVRGKIVLTEGLPSARGKIKQLSAMGAVAVVFISPGHNIHEGIATTIFGAPDLDNDGEQPTIPILSVNKADGGELRELAETSTIELNVVTRTETGWYPCPLIVAEIAGSSEPEKFVLLHGHMDSWHVGVGDNATGDAALLEMARVFSQHRHLLKRSLRIAWWPGHSTGRYAGSVWYVDNFGFDLENNCIAQVNCDSPGCRWATSYEYMNWMSEVDGFCQSVIWDAVGQKSRGTRPPRAGDYSFNNIGVTSFFMLSSTIPEDVLQDKQYYAVGGCGGNIEWHTEDDDLRVYDPEIQLKDMKIYATAVYRMLNAPVHPLNFITTVQEMLQTLNDYQKSAGKRFSFALAEQEGQDLLNSLSNLNTRLAALQGRPLHNCEVRAANRALQKLSRILVRINYSRRGRFRHDPAVSVPPLPDIAPVSQLAKSDLTEHQMQVLTTHLVRGTNRIASAFREARDVIEVILGGD
jgi:N-acetylated-alpha-linked acidic dipeptidase